ncbi:MAG: hypothetical protein ACK4FW_01670 [Stenotrophomonas sp.]
MAASLSEAGNAGSRPSISSNCVRSAPLSLARSAVTNVGSITSSSIQTDDRMNP